MTLNLAQFRIDRTLLCRSKTQRSGYKPANLETDAISRGRLIGALSLKFRTRCYQFRNCL
jgi:hypothetical protein